MGDRPFGFSPTLELSVFPETEENADKSASNPAQQSYYRYVFLPIEIPNIAFFMYASSLTFVAAGGGGFLDFEESVRSSKVLQGQENIGFISPLYGCDIVNRPLDFDMQPPAHQNLASSTTKKATMNELIRAQPTTYTSFVESSRFPKVLQGQEICQLRSLTGKTNINLGAWAKPSLGCTSFSNYQAAAKPNFFPLASESLQNTYFPYGDIHRVGPSPCATLSNAANFPRESVNINPYSIQSGILRNEVGKPNVPNEFKPQENISAHPTLGANIKSPKDDDFGGTVTGCKLFGFSLTGETTTPNSQSSSKRSCTKVSYSSGLLGLNLHPFLFTTLPTDVEHIERRFTSKAV